MRLYYNCWTIIERSWTLRWFDVMIMKSVYCPMKLYYKIFYKDYNTVFCNKISYVLFHYDTMWLYLSTKYTFIVYFSLILKFVCIIFMCMLCVYFIFILYLCVCVCVFNSKLFLLGYSFLFLSWMWCRCTHYGFSNQSTSLEAHLIFVI